MRKGRLSLANEYGAKQAARARVVLRLVRQKPQILAIPLLLLSLLVGLGVFGVIKGSEQTSRNARQRAQYHVDSAASSLKLSMQEVIMPAWQLADMIQHTLDYTTMTSQWRERMPAWWNRVSSAGLLVLNMVPFGKISNVYPENYWNLQWVGVDLLGHPDIRRNVVEAIENGDITIGEPAWVGTQIYAMSIQIPVMIKDVDENVTFGIPHQPTDCPMCYNAATRTRWWGNAAMTFNVTALLESMPALVELQAAGFQVQIWRPPHASYGETERVVVNPNGPRPQPKNSNKAKFPVANVEWEIYVWQDSWQPNWEKPLFAVVVVASLICSSLLFAMLLSWEEHRLLLHSLLPKDTINRMRAEMDYTNIDEAMKNANMVQLETPAQHMMTIIHACIDGMPAPINLLLSVRDTLQRSGDVYRPAAAALQNRIQEGNMDAEVGQALVRQLMGTPSNFMDSSEDEAVLLVVEGRSATEATQDECCIDDDDNSRKLAKKLAHSVEAPAVLYKDDGTMPENVSEAVGLLMHLHKPDVLEKMKAAIMAKKPNALTGPPEKPILDQLEVVLHTANTWQFDAYALEEASAGRPLSVLSYWLLHTTGLLAWAKMDATKLARFLQRVEEGYPNNPYHNRRHAADVLQTLHMMLQHGGLAPGYADQQTTLGCYLAAIVHDFDHRGRTNDYLINTHDDLAVCYNDRSPMENHHLAASFGLMKKPDYHFLSNMSKSNWDKLRKLVIEMVLATDMKQHFSIVSQFTAVHSTNPGAASARHSTTSNDTIQGSASSVILAPLSDTDRLLSLQMALKCADLGHLTAPLAVHLRWVGALEEELFLQGDAERTAGMAISPLCDRNKEGVTKSQVGFFDFVVLPLFNGFTQRFSQTKPLLRAVVANYQHWQSVTKNAEPSTPK